MQITDTMGATMLRLIPLVVALSLAPAHASEERLASRIEEIRRQLGATRIAVSFRDFQTGRRFALRERETFAAASMIKVAVMVAAYDGVHRGRFTLDTPVPVTNHFRGIGVGGPVRATELDRDVHAALGGTLTVGQLTEAMVAASSNLATNCLLQFIGLRNAAASFDALGLPGMRLGSGMGRGSGSSNVVSAAGFDELLTRLHEGRVISPEASTRMLAHLFAQKITNGIPSGFPLQKRRTLRIAHKTGNIPTVEHDAGLIYMPGRKPYVLAIMTSWPGRGDDHPAALVRVTEAVHAELVEP
jgi:beta-lactamase class A